MSYCLNPYCSRPQNPEANFCAGCGFRLRLGDRYRALKLIGRGGFGRTFLAVDEYKPSRPHCVIKQFFPQNQIPHDPELAKELFQREAVQLEQLGTHPQIPELLAHFEQADYQYLVQEFIEGPNLVQQVGESGAFNEAQIWYLLNDLLPVLEFIHHHQVIHRDIKPQNIIRRQSSQQYVLVDFGAAKAVGGLELGQTGTSIGSPEFTPPEQAIGKATYASDLYSLGVTCIYLLTQVRPADLFDTIEGSWVWQCHLERPVNGVLSAILDKLLQGPIKLRYQSAAEVLHDLQAAKIVQALAAPTEENRQRGAPLGPPLSDTTQITRLPPTARVTVDREPSWRCDRTLTGHQSWVRSVAIHPNSTQLASGSGDRTIKIWDLATGTLERTISAHTSWVRAIAISPDGQTLASCSNDKTVKLWQWDTGTLLHTLEGHSDWVRSVAFSPDGTVLASSSQDRSIQLWYVATGKRLQTLRGHEHWVLAVVFAPVRSKDNFDESCVISGSRDTTVRVWNWGRDSLATSLLGHTGAVNGLAISPNGQFVASGSDDATVRVWEWRTGTLLHTLTGHQNAVHSVKIASSGKFIVSGSQDRTIKLWDLHTGTLLYTLPGHSNWIWSVALSQDGTTIASGSWDSTVKIWRKDG